MYRVNIRNLRCGPMPEEVVNFRVDRRSPVGNPFTMLGESTRDFVCQKYKIHFDSTIKHSIDTVFVDYLILMVAVLKKHKVVNLYCWCVPERCHALTIKKHLLSKVKEKQ